MKTLKNIIVLRGSKYTDEAKNPSYTEFWQGYFEGWKDAYRDLKEILVQNGFNLDVPVTDVGKTNADHIRSMTDEELMHWCNHTCPPNDKWKSCGGGDFDECEKCWLDWLQQPYKGENK